MNSGLKPIALFRRQEFAFDARPDCVADAAVGGELFGGGAGCFAGVVEGSVEALARAGENGAGFVGVVADGDDGGEWFAEVALEGFGFLRGDVDAEFGHGLDRQGAHAGCFGPGAQCGEAVAAEVSQQPFRHL